MQLSPSVTPRSQPGSNHVVQQHPAGQPRDEAGDRAQKRAGEMARSPQQRACNGAQQQAGRAEQQRDLDQADGIVENADV